MIGRTPASPLRRTALWLFLVVFAFCASLTKGHFEGSDQMELYQTTQGLWEKGTLHTLGSFTIFRGNWLSYAHTSIGSAVLALPLYGVGKLADRSLRAAGWERARKALAGPIIEINPTWRWGGEVPMFFVDLFPALAVAGTCVLFFLFGLRLGADPRWALAAALLLGTCSYFAYNGAEFFQHPAESFFLLLCVFFLSADWRQPSRRTRFFAGLAAGALFFCRYQTAVALPPLFLAAAWSSRREAGADARGPAKVRALVRGTAPFSIPVAVAVAAHLAINYAKLGILTIVPESASNEPFHFHVLSGLYGLIASPGAGILLFCPLLLLLPATLPPFRRRFPFETALIGGLALVYLVFYASFDYWSGQWCYGPRYLTALVPLLFLPLPGWMEARGRRGWRAVAPLAFLGLVVVLLGAAVNYSYQYYAAGYSLYKPMYSFVYSVRGSQLVTNAKSVVAANHCVDLWLVQVFRSFGVLGFLAAAIPLAALLALSGWRLCVWARRTSAAAPEPVRDPAGRGSARFAAALAGVVVAATAALWAADRDRGFVDPEKVMRRGMDALYVEHNPTEAIRDFRRVLELNPNHYGATFQLGRALDQIGRPDEATASWLRMREMASRSGDADTLRIVDERLGRSSSSAAESMMKAGMQALYDRNDPGRAAELFRRVLLANPDHYGANYQIGVALDRLEKRKEARPYWERALALAQRYADAPTEKIVRDRLAQEP